MKKIYIIITITILRLNITAQVDMGIENWVNSYNSFGGAFQDPQGWTSFNYLINAGPFSMAKTVFEETTAPYSGFASAKIVTEVVPSLSPFPNPYQGNQNYDTIGMLAMGSIELRILKINYMLKLKSNLIIQ